MTPAQLKANVEARGSLFFDRRAMRFFGDTMANYGVRSDGEFWELYRRRPVKHGLQSSAYFRKDDFSRAWPYL